MKRKYCFLLNGVCAGAAILTLGNVEANNPSLARDQKPSLWLISQQNTMLSPEVQEIRAMVPYQIISKLTNKQNIELVDLIENKMRSIRAIERNQMRVTNAKRKLMGSLIQAKSLDEVINMLSASEAQKENISQEANSPAGTDSGLNKDAQEVLDNVLLSIRIQLNPTEKEELSKLINQRVSAILASHPPAFMLSQSKNRLIRSLGVTKSMEEMRRILTDSGASPENAQVLKELQEATRQGARFNVESKVEASQEINAAERLKLQIDQETDRVMSEGGLNLLQDLDQEGEDIIYDHIKSIVSKYYHKEIPNLTMQSDPIGALITLVRSKNRSRAQVDEMLKEFDKDIARFEKYVLWGRELDEKAKDVIPLSEQVVITPWQIVGHLQQLLPVNSGAYSQGVFFKFNQSRNPEEKKIFDQIAQSKNSGFVIVPVGKETSNVQVNLKFLTLVKKRNSIEKGSGYMNFPVNPYIADWLKNELLSGYQYGASNSEPPYEFWGISSEGLGLGSYVKYAVFAVPRDPRLPIYSLSSMSKSLTGSIINDLKTILSDYNPPMPPPLPSQRPPSLADSKRE